MLSRCCFCFSLSAHVLSTSPLCFRSAEERARPAPQVPSGSGSVLGRSAPSSGCSPGPRASAPFSCFVNSCWAARKFRVSSLLVFLHFSASHMGVTCRLWERTCSMFLFPNWVEVLGLQKHLETDGSCGQKSRSTCGRSFVAGAIFPCSSVLRNFQAQHRHHLTSRKILKILSWRLYFPWTLFLPSTPMWRAFLGPL